MKLLLPVVALAAIGFVQVRAARAQSSSASSMDGAQGSASEDPSFQDEAQKRWLIHTSRMEGASVNIREAADTLASTAQRVQDGGRIAAMSQLMGDLNELNRRVVSASLAAEVLDQ